MGACCSREEELQADFSQDVNLAHFELVKEIGKGAFGKVKIVKHKQTGKEYALKYIAKDLCVEKKAINSIILERVMLEDIHCPFVCNLRYAFQDDEYLFMVIDLKPGGDLRYLIGRVGALKEDIAKFMIAEVMLGIMYLHSRRVVHKDIKPENSERYGSFKLGDNIFVFSSA
ncbi:serine/threonine-protein kinase 32A [Chytriomyces sp. MP71]|nr:serine/threonine-protein kinase 32A [Chytriomyces sp. MP71]